jgi:Cu2+-exporting ATPase
VQTADRLAGWFVAAVLALAALTAVLWWSRGPAAALDHAIALLIVTCPCALGLATPLALSAAVGQAARAGLLVKGADVLEALTRGGRLWLDKTGTVTTGELRVVAWEGDPEARVLAAALEAHSAHPVARAIVAAVPRHLPAGEAVETQGGGVRGRVGGREVSIGSAAYVAAEATVPPALAATAESWSVQGLTVVLVAVDGTVRAVAALGDRLRDEAAGAVPRLRALGFRPGLLSGDHSAAVAAVARRMGIDREDARGAVSPERKLEVIRASAAEGPVVMVGDGVNDAAALAAAGVGIAVHGGAEAALAAADVYVAHPGIDAVVRLVEGAHRALAVVRRNLAFSLLYNIAGVALAMTGVLDPVVAAVLMPISSLTVIVSSYRARTFSPCP